MTKSMGSLFEGLENELLQAYKAITPEQLAEDERRRKIKRDYDALHTAFETDEDRADLNEYPEGEEE